MSMSTTYSRRISVSGPWIDDHRSRFRAMQVIGKELGTTTDLGSDQPTHQIDSAANDVVRHPMLISFTSGNIACVITSIRWQIARSQRAVRDWSPPPQPADCQPDCGHAVLIGVGRPAEFLCAGDTTDGPQGPDTT